MVYERRRRNSRWGSHRRNYGTDNRADLYDESGDVAGTVRGVDEEGVFLTTEDGFESLSIEHVRPSHAFGEAELMWWCMDCSEMGTIEDGLPETCPGCATGREGLMYWIED